MKNIEPNEIPEFLAKQPDAVLIDVRFGYELDEVGYLRQSHHIPLYMPDWEMNAGFVQDVAAIAQLDTPIVIICRTGNRSCAAVEMLEEYGFTCVYNLMQGFVGMLDQAEQCTQGVFEGLLARAAAQPAACHV